MRFFSCHETRHSTFSQFAYKVATDEENLSAQQQEEKEKSRLSKTQELSGRQECPAAQEGKGKKKARRITSDRLEMGDA